MDIDKLQTVLVADASGVGRALIARLLRPYARRTVEVGSAAEARDWLSMPHLSLVIVDTSDDDAFSLLEDISRLDQKPAVLVLTTNPNTEEETRATLLGAIAYIAKPVSLREILRSLRSTATQFNSGPQRAYTEPLAHVIVVDPDTKVAQVTWDVRDLSSAGALIRSQASLPIGTRLQLLLVMNADEVPVDAEVVRSQEPSWALDSGAAVVFHYASDSARLRVERFVSECSPSTGSGLEVLLAKRRFSISS